MTDPSSPPPSPPPDIYTLFPGRKAQIDALLPILTHPTLPAPPTIFLSGLPGTGKTTLLKCLLKDVSNMAWVNCVERFTERLVFEGVLRDWGVGRRCDGIAEFVGVVKEMEAEEKRILVFDKAERLRDMSSTLLPALMRLPDLARFPLTIILVTHLTWTDFRSRIGSLDPSYTVHFPSYTKSETLAILAKDCPPTEDVEFFVSFVEILYEVFSKPCRDVRELRYLVALWFPKYVEPVLNGKVTRQQTSKLFGFIQPHIKDALHSVYLRDLSSHEYQKASVKSNHVYDVDLPYYTKFLLIAAFLASYNPPRLDVRFFSKGDVGSRKKKGGRRGRVSSEGGKMRQQLLGPKAFPIERLLAIFYSILENSLESSIDIYQEIASLVSLRLLVRVTTPDRLDGVKCKCNVGLEFVNAVAKSVKFDVGKYLFDFV
ncbi:hypothetical protein SpCBS45565_g06279 [Spizellomyces sp. 'palustris']|nr:hypothetical protein SpCBS45565_g06279 [Spizellomyces sp. 'palustris']